MEKEGVRENAEKEDVRKNEEGDVKETVWEKTGSRVSAWKIAAKGDASRSGSFSKTGGCRCFVGPFWMDIFVNP